jgi:hypothetical protein
VNRKNVHQNCCYFSLQFNESTDIVDTSQKIMFIRLVFPDIIHNEEFLTMIPVKETTKDEIIYPQFVSLLWKQAFIFGNLCVLLPMGPQPWPVRKMGFLQFGVNKPTSATIHCVIHQNALCRCCRCHCLNS